MVSKKKCTFVKMGKGNAFERARMSISDKNKTKKRHKETLKDRAKRLKEWKNWWG
tara:strand:- start:113 stop:277 length:165 start_codon:yes stop_codon:yes gene_type:complete